MEYCGYSEIIIAIYQAAMQPELWADTLDHIADFLGVDSGMVLHQSASHSGTFVIHRRLREDLIQQFLKHHTRNPYAFAFARAPIGKALVTQALIEREELQQSAFYADILAPLGIAEIIAVRHPDLSREGAGGILFNVSSRRADIAEQAAERLNPLASHLSRAIDLTLLTRRLNANQRRLDDLLASAMGATILLDRHGCILRMTNIAEKLLSQRDGLLITNSSRLTLGAHSHNEATGLANSIKQALAVARGEAQSLGGMLQITRPSGRRAFLIQVTPLPPQSFSPWEAFDAGARVMVQIIDPQASIDPQAERLRLLVGLTDAETRVAALLGSGHGVAETASVLDVSLNTAKTHARHVYAKAGVRSATALVRLMASIPAGPPDLEAGKH